MSAAFASVVPRSIARMAGSRALTAALCAKIGARAVLAVAEEPPGLGALEWIEGRTEVERLAKERAALVELAASDGDRAGVGEQPGVRDAGGGGIAHLRRRHVVAAE